MTESSSEPAPAYPHLDLPHARCIDLAVVAADIDAYQHVNNAVYVAWCDRAAWHHSAAVGLPIERCLDLDRGMAGAIGTDEVWTRGGS